MRWSFRIYVLTSTQLTLTLNSQLFYYQILKKARENFLTPPGSFYLSGGPVVARRGGEAHKPLDKSCYPFLAKKSFFVVSTMTKSGTARQMLVLHSTVLPFNHPILPFGERKFSLSRSSVNFWRHYDLCE